MIAGSAAREHAWGCRLTESVSGVSGAFPPSRADLCSVRRDRDSLRLSGEIDVGNVAAVSARIQAEIRAGVVHLDLSEVGYCGAAGLRALLAGRDALRDRGGVLRLTCSPVVLRILRICELIDSAGMIVVPATGPRAPRGAVCGSSGPTA